VKVLVTGATGFVGQRLVQALLARRDGVRALGRNEQVLQALQAAGAEAVRADLCDRAMMVGACTEVEAVCHVGALSAPWGPRREFFAVNVDGTAHVLEGCRTHRVGRLVHISSPSVVFDGRDHRNLTEDAPYPRRSMSVYSLTKKLGEDLVRAASREGLEAVILRPKAIFGPGDTSLLPRLLTAARQGRLPQIGDGRNLVDLTYVDNVVQAILAALTAPAAAGKVYTITNGEHVPLWEVIRMVLERLGYPTRLRRLPYRLAYALAAGLELKAALFGGEPLLTRYTTAILARTQTYQIDAARRDLRYIPAVSVAQGITRTLEFLTTAESHAASNLARPC
jgi:nucleoside-diphosphate-sugar epimerase